MSIISLIDEEIVRTEQYILRDRLSPSVFKYIQKIVPKYEISPDKVPLLTDDLLPLAAESPTEKTKVSAALDSLARYIPTEVITLYVAASSAMPMIKQTFKTVTEARVYWFFGMLTPILFLLIFFGKRKNSGMCIFPQSIKKWPWWKLAASTIAFLVWALALPTTPYLSGVAGKVVAAFGALFVSMFLTLLEPFFEP